MNEQYYLITYDQFVSRKLINQKEIVLTDNIVEAIKKLTIFNAEKRLSTTNYQKANLTELFAKHHITLEQHKPPVEEVVEEDEA